MINRARLEAQNIAMSYGTNVVLRDINLVIEPGEFFALLGPSGSGKSTLLRLIAGFNHAQAGHLLINAPTFRKFRRGHATSAWFFRTTRCGRT
jgi:iron(III) transport system ATP-binding protein